MDLRDSRAMTDEAVLAVLTRIAVALETQVALMVPPVPEPVPVTCPHAEEDRADFGLTDGLPDGECRRCGFRPLAARTTTQSVRDVLLMVAHGG